MWHKRPQGPALRLASAFPIQAWLTEIQEYAQQDVVLMLLGNKVGLWACPLQPGPQGAPGTGTNEIPVPGQVDSTQDRVVKREDGEKLAKVSRQGGR